MSSNNEHNKNLQTVEALVSKWKEEGNTYYHQKNYPPAIDQYSKIIQLLKLQHSLFSSTNPHHIDEALKQNLLNILYVSYSNRCACYLQVHNVSAAHQDAKECISLKPEWPKGYNRLANCLTRLGKYEEALAAYEQLIILEPNQASKIRQEMQRLRDQMNSGRAPPSSSSSSSTNSNNNNSNSSNNNPFSSFQSIPWQSYYHSIQRTLLDYYGKLLAWFMTLSEEHRNYLKLGLLAFFVYYFFFSHGIFGGPSYSSRRGYDYYDYGYGYGGYSRGLSWTAWIAIIAGAYYLPPMFPQVLGDQFARPFFGLNFTTFIWLVQIFSNSNRGGYGYYGRPRRYYY